MASPNLVEHMDRESGSNRSFLWDNRSINAAPRNHETVSKGCEQVIQV